MDIDKLLLRYLQHGKECWINVYLTRSGKVVQGYCLDYKNNNVNCKILYRIHVRLK